jgi:hypothetical protein
MSDEIGFRLSNNDGKRKKNRKLSIILEHEEQVDAGHRLEAAFEMLFPNVAQPLDDSQGPSEPKPGTQLPLF